MLNDSKDYLKFRVSETVTDKEIIGMYDKAVKLLPMKGEKEMTHKHNGHALAYIKSVGSLDTGGHIIVDAVELTDKTVLIIGEELVCQYSSLDAFLEGENSLHCIERIKLSTR